MNTKQRFGTASLASRFLFLALLLAVWNVPAKGQDLRDLDWKQRIFFGGNFGLLLGTETYIDVSPVVGYRLTDRLSAGLGPIYQYYSIKTFGVRYSYHIYGGRAFASFSLIKDLNRVVPLGVPLSLFAYGENQALNMERQLVDLNLSPDAGRFWLNNVLVGGGLGQSIGNRSALNIMVLWNLNPTAINLYSNPVVRFGFSF